jgi:hypothetical protein
MTRPTLARTPLWRVELLGGLRAVHDKLVVTRFRRQKTGTLLAYLQALTELIRRREQEGDLVGAVAYARRVVAADPVHEEGHSELIRLLAMAGDPAAARRQYQELERLLEQELGETPCPATRALVAALRGGAEAVRSAPRGGHDAHAVAPSSTPTGTFTFLLTDAAPAGGPERLRRELGRHAGRVVRETEGALLLAFPRASDALAAAVASQPTASAGVEPPRTALHTGEVEIEAGRYQGLALDHVVRLLRAAHPGQILLSEATAVLLRGEVEPGKPSVGIIDLGVYRLWDAPAGVGMPERIFQVSSPERMPREFPPPQAQPFRRGQLPLQLTRLFGRESEIAELRTRLTTGETRLVTLTGPGGSGKTRLALAVAESVFGRFRGAVWFVPLAEVTHAAPLVDALATALELSHTAGESHWRGWSRRLPHSPPSWRSTTLSGSSPRAHRSCGPCWSGCPP